MSKKHFSVKRNAVAVACGLALAAGAFAPAVAMADRHLIAYGPDSNARTTSACYKPLA